MSVKRKLDHVAPLSSPLTPIGTVVRLPPPPPSNAAAPGSVGPPPHLQALTNAALVQPASHKAGKERDRRLRISKLVKQLRGLTGCTNSARGDILRHAIQQLTKFQSWQQQAIEEIERLTEVAAHVVPEIEMPPSSSTVACLVSGRLLQVGSLLLEMLQASMTAPNPDGGYTIAHVAASENGDSGTSKIIRMMHAQRSSTQERHVVSWRGYDLMINVSATLILDQAGRPYQCILEFHPVKVAQSLPPSDHCPRGNGFCTRFCVNSKINDPDHRPGQFNTQMVLQKLAKNAPGAQL